MITPAHCRAARALLDWSQPELAEKAQIGLSTVRGFELGKQTRGQNVEAIERVLTSAGIRLISDEGVGVVLLTLKNLGVLPMNNSEKNAFRSKSIMEAYKEVARYSFWVGWEGGAQEIRVVIKEDTDGRFWFSQSHYIHTPEQAGPYVTSRNFGSTIEDALTQAVETITSYFDPATRSGHNPSNKWFVENDRF